MVWGRLSPPEVVGDKGYTGRRLRSYLTESWYPLYHPTIVTLSHVEVLKACEIYRQRNSELNMLSTDSNNGAGSLPDMKSWLQIIQLRSRSPAFCCDRSLKTRPSPSL